MAPIAAARRGVILATTALDDERAAVPMTVQHPTLSARRVGRYELLHRLGSGGMGTVFLARARGPGGFERAVAVKLCREELRDSPELSSQFLEEAKITARIRHPNVVATLDVGESEELLYLVMELVEGGSLADLVHAARRRGERVPVPVVVRIALDALRGLEAAHGSTDERGRPRGLVHRDVSPQNILVGVDGVARVADFGIAAAEARTRISRPGHARGKVAYMAPEQILGERLTRQCDLFALGVTLWEALAGRPLFDGDSEAAVMNRVLRMPIPRVADVGVPIAPGLDAAVAAALARATTDRARTALELETALERCGVTPASPRVVGQYVEAALAPALQRLRSLLLEAPAAESPGPPGPSADRESPTSLVVDVVAPGATDPAPPADAAPVVETPTVAISSPALARTRAPGLTLASLAAGALLVVGTAAWATVFRGVRVSTTDAPGTAWQVSGPPSSRPAVPDLPPMPLGSAGPSSVVAPEPARPTRAAEAAFEIEEAPSPALRPVLDARRGTKTKPRPARGAPSTTTKKTSRVDGVGGEPELVPFWPKEP